MRVGYKSPESLLQAFTQSVGQGQVQLPSRRNVVLGTRFLFELHLKRLKKPVEVQGEVVRVNAVSHGVFNVTVQYAFGQDRSALDATLKELFDDHQRDKVRSNPRVPFHVIAQDESGNAKYRIRDLSKGGAGLEVISGDLSPEMIVGVPVFLEIHTSDGVAGIHGAIAWVRASPEDPRKHGMGIRFGKLQVNQRQSLDRLLILYGLPTGGWRAKVTFGMDAVSRMP